MCGEFKHRSTHTMMLDCIREIPFVIPFVLAVRRARQVSMCVVGRIRRGARRRACPPERGSGAGPRRAVRAVLESKRGKYSLGKVKWRAERFSLTERAGPQLGCSCVQCAEARGPAARAASTTP